MNEFLVNFSNFKVTFFLVILYAVTAVYFAGVMVRLMLTLTPVVCILAGIAFSNIFDKYLIDEDCKKNVDNKELKEGNGGKYFN